MVCYREIINLPLYRAYKQEESVVNGNRLRAGHHASCTQGMASEPQALFSHDLKRVDHKIWSYWNGRFPY